MRSLKSRAFLISVYRTGLCGRPYIRPNPQPAVCSYRQYIIPNPQPTVFSYRQILYTGILCCRLYEIWQQFFTDFVLNDIFIPVAVYNQYLFHILQLSNASK